MAGYIKDHRKELESDIWLMPPLYHRTWQWLKYNVNHEDNEIPMRDGARMLIKRGQRLTSIRDIAKGISWYEGKKYKEPNPKTIDAILNFMVKANMILINRGKGNREYTLVTLINYEIYNKKESQGNSKVTPDGEGREQQADINNNDKNDKNEKPSSPKRVYDEQSLEYRTANYLYTNILKFKPDLKKPNLQVWANDMRMLIELDKKEAKEIGQVIEWVTKDEFWKVNILSASKLRSKWDTVTARMKQGNFKPTNKQQTNLQLVTVTEEERKELHDALNKQRERNGISNAVNS